MSGVCGVHAIEDVWVQVFVRIAEREKLLGIYERKCEITVEMNFNLLKPTGYVMYQQFNIQQLYVLPTQCIYVICIYLTKNSDLCYLQHKLVGFYNRDEKCLLRGTNWVFT